MKLTSNALADCTGSVLRPRAGACAQAQISGDVVKIGFITDMSGLYADIDGQGGAEAIKMAIADFGGKVNGKKIELLIADHQNKADIAARKAREWFDTARRRHADRRHQLRRPAWRWPRSRRRRRSPFIVDRRRHRARLTNEDCTPYTVHYAYDTVALAKGTGNAVVKQGGKTWYFLTADYAFGHSLENDTADVVKANGGTGARRGAPSAVGIRLLVVPAAGAVVQGADPGPGQCRRRHHQRDQGGQRIRHHQDDEARRPAGVHQRRALARPCS